MATREDFTPELSLWWAYIYLKIDDAMGCFKVPSGKRLNSNTVVNIVPLEEQYQNFRTKFKDSGVKLPSRNYLKSVGAYGGASYATGYCDRARMFLESSEFDEIMEYLGYGSAYVNKWFAMVQEAITYEKKLYDEFGLKKDAAND